MCKFRTPVTSDFSFEKLIGHSSFMEMVHGKVFYVYTDDSTFVPVSPEDSMPDKSLHALVMGRTPEGKVITFLAFEGSLGLAMTARKDDDSPSYMEQYKAKLKALDVVPEFKSGITITVSKDLVEKIKPVLKRMESKTLAARSYIEGKLISIDPNQKDDIVHQTKGAVRTSENGESYKIKIDSEFMVRVVEFAEVALDESIRIATGLMNLLNFKAIEALFESHVSKIAKRDNELK